MGGLITGGGFAVEFRYRTSRGLSISMSDESYVEKTDRRTLLKRLAGSAMASALPLEGAATVNPLSLDRGFGSASKDPRSEKGADRGYPPDPPGVVLEDSELRVAFDPTSGAIIHLEYKPTNWALHRRPELGVSFRMQVPLPERHDNFILGQKQRAVKVEKSGNQVHLEWSHLVSEHAGVLPITFTATATLDHGALTFESSLTNNCTLPVNTVGYPYLGDLSAPTPKTPMWRRHMWYGNLESQQIHPHFNNEKGYWGDMSPIQTASSNQSLFCLIQSIGQGLYVQVSDHVARYLVQYWFEQKPGDLESIYDLVPEEDQISGIPVHLELRLVHFVFAAPKSTVKFTPIVLKGYKGDWQAGADLYKAWRKTWFHPRTVPEWVNEVHSWQQLQINSPEDSLRYRYDQLPEFGNECAANGVSAIQLVGWNKGGQDRGNPTQDTDPRLGTTDELRDAIAQCQEKGVHIVLFGKFLWADMTTKWYRRELYKYDTKDPYGIPYEAGGYSYDTPEQLAGINNRRFGVMCFMDKEYLRIAADLFKKDVALKPAGFLYDEVCHHGPALYCFAADHGHPVPAFVYNGDIPMAEALNADTNDNPDFLFAGEGPEDIVIQHYPLSYFRIGDQHTPICRYLDSHAPLMVAITGFDDREKLNRLLMYRYIISYEPYNFKGRLSNFPLTLEYGKKIDALRKRYTRWLWNAEYRDTLGAKVTVDGKPHHLYSVFLTSSGERAVVVVNQSPSRGITASVKITNPRRLVIVTPEEPETKPTRGTVTIPARSAAVILEMG